MGEKLIRCAWAKSPEEVHYHDTEWGVPVLKDQKLFEFLILDAFQAGLSWRTILVKRENFRNAFDGFDAHKIAQYDDKKVAQLLSDAGIIRNRLKVAASITNARAFLKLVKEEGSFTNYLWSFVNNKPINNKFQHISEIPARTNLSDAISKDLKKRGFKFVGTTIIYAFIQAAGLVNDHEKSCFRYQEVVKCQEKLIKALKST